MDAVGGTKELRVLVISLGRRGGVTEYGRLMALSLSRVATVAVVSSTFAENAGEWGEFEGEHLRVDTFSSAAGMLLSILSVGKLAKIRRFVLDFDPDVIYYPGGHAWKPLLHLLLPKRYVTVLTVHDPELHTGEDTPFHRLFSAVNRWRTDAYVLLNRSQAQRYADAHHLAESQLAVIPHGIFDRHAGQSLALTDFPSLKALDLQPRGYLLFVGRIVAYKGVEVLLRAYVQAAAYLDLPLVIAGAGELSDEEKGLIEQASAAQVKVVNRWLLDEETSALVGSAKFVVLPYTGTTQSGVIPLASALGVPSIASRLGGLAEQVSDGQTGFLFTAGNTSDLSEVLVRAAKMPDEDWEAMSRACKSHAETEWNWDALAARLLTFMAPLVHNKNRRGA